MYGPGWYTSGHMAPNVPVALKRLPFNLRRSHLYPRDPALVREAVEADLTGQPPPVAYLPQRMAFSRWKTPPYQVAYGSNVAGLLQALRDNLANLRGLQAYATQRIPGMSPHQAVAALGADRLPQPSDNLEPNLFTTPLAREAVPLNHLVSADELNEFANQYTSYVTNRNVAIAEKRQRAQAAVAQQHFMTTSRVMQATSAPWFLQSENR